MQNGQIVHLSERQPLVRGPDDSESSSPATVSSRNNSITHSHHQSHSNPHSPAAKVLARNSACHQCRKRKLKCDARKPICVNCSKPRIRGTGSPNDQDGCTWDEIKEPSARTRRRREHARKKAEEQGKDDVGAGLYDRSVDNDSDNGDHEGESKRKRTRLNQLENRIAAFEAALESNHQIDPSLNHESNNVAAADWTSTVPSSFAGDTHNEQPRGQFNPQRNKFMGNMLSGDSYNAQAGTASSNTVIFDFDPILPAVPFDTDVDLKQRSDFDIPLDGIFDVIYPDWPQDLPQRAVVEHMINVFFDKVPLIPRMLRKSSLLQALHLPPSQSGFPIRPILHAILAVTSNFISPVALSTRAYFPVGSSHSDITHPERDFELGVHGSIRQSHSRTFDADCRERLPVTPLARFQLWHRRKAFETADSYIDRGEFLACLQARIIATYTDLYNGWWTDLWMNAGSAIRMVTPLRINESPHEPEGSLRRFVSTMLLPAKTLVEQAERDRTFWSAFILERCVSICTFWPSNLVDDEITVELPVRQSVYDQGFGSLAGVQTLHTPNLLISHPSEHLDSFCILIKALKISYEVNVFFRRYSRGSHSTAGYLSNPTFRYLLESLNAFRANLPPDLRRPVNSYPSSGTGAAKVDKDLLMALWVIHAASLTLGEPLVTPETWTSECGRMTLSSIRASLSLLYDLAATSYDVTGLLPHCAQVWGLSARALVRFIDAATRSGDHVSAAVFRSEIAVFRLALQQYAEKFPIGVKQLKMLDDLVAQQDMWGGTANEHQTRECTISHIVGLVRDVGGQSAGTSSVEVTTPQEVLIKGLLASTSTTTTSTLTSTFVPDSKSIWTRDMTNKTAPAPMTPMAAMLNLQSDIFSTSTSTSTSAPPPPQPLSQPPMIINPDNQNGFDISSFSFDYNAITNQYLGSTATFDGADFASYLGV